MPGEQARSVRDWIRLALCLAPLALAPSVPNAGPIAAFVLAVVTVAALPAARGPSLALISGTWGKSIVIGLAAALAFGLASHFYEPFIARLTGEPINLNTFSNVKGNPSSYLTLLAIAIIVGGIFEEFVFRGFLIGWGSALLGEKAAPLLALASAVAFGLAHSYQGLTGMLTTGLNGLLFGAVYICAGRRLLPAMICHAAGNVYGITMLYLGA